MSLGSLLIHRGLLFAIVLTWVQYPAVEADSFNVIEKLHENLLESYNKQIRPVMNHTQAVNLQAGLTLTNFDFDESLSKFSAKGFFYMEWKDPRFMWSPADYEGLKSIHLPSEKVWKPDLEVYNSYGTLSDDRSFAANDVLITSDGTVIFVPISKLDSICISDATLYPFDSVTCTTIIGSWTHNAYEININTRKNTTTVDVQDLTSRRMLQWNLMSTNASIEVKVYDCCPEPYANLRLSFTMQRSLSASSAVITPTVVIAILTLAIFFIPPAVGAKLVVGVLNVVVHCIFLLYLKTILPSGSINTPVIVSFYSGSLVAAMFSVLFTILSLRWTRFPKLIPPPALIQNCLTGRVGILLGVEHKYSSNRFAQKELIEKNSQQFVSNDSESRDVEIQQEWLSVCLALDRIMVFIYCTFMAVSISSFLC
ncbi:neuronal acetylcholine receptor subunit alpha-2-like [Daphnia carinata]|uniref:neuronal acetylcholine receptor subunit alpha-2-like n=1 Tax=Daphnia carinata TaxID=120202 RepID=UPI00257E6B92|nr:neuronal acetylcholine receptor subunit alpha-2-like [Daphnia carinata]